MNKYKYSYNGWVNVFSISKINKLKHTQYIYSCIPEYKMYQEYFIGGVLDKLAISISINIYEYIKLKTYEKFTI